MLIVIAASLTKHVLNEGRTQNEVTIQLETIVLVACCVYEVFASAAANL